MKHREHKDSTKCHPGVLEDRLVPERSEDDANLLENIFKAYICTLARTRSGPVTLEMDHPEKPTPSGFRA